MDERSRMSEVAVGAFVLAALAILVAGSLWVAGSGVFGGSRAAYRVLLKDSAGLQAGDRVRVAGVAVGRIQDVRLRPGEEWPVMMRVVIDSDVPVREDGTASISTSGLLGTAFLEIDPGSADAPRLAEGGEIRGGMTPGLDDALSEVGEISDRAKELLDQAGALIETVSEEIGPVLTGLESMMSERNARNLEQLLATANRTLDDTGPRLADLLERMDALAESAERGLGDLPELTARLSALGEDLQTALGPEGARLRRLLDAAGTSLESADQALAAVGGSRGELEAALRDLREAAANLKAFSQHVKERPFSLVRIKAPPDRRPGDGVRESGR